MQSAPRGGAVEPAASAGGKSFYFEHLPTQEPHSGTTPFGEDSGKVPPSLMAGSGRVSRASFPFVTLLTTIQFLTDVWTVVIVLVRWTTQAEGRWSHRP